MRRLIVNADDFGLTPGINQAVITLHRAQALTSTTLMAEAPHFQQAVALALQHPSLGVGCHIVLVDGTPLSPPDTIPTLLAANSTSTFRPTLGSFVRDLFFGRIHAQQIRQEATAQIQHLQAQGIHVTHVDTHKHTHMFPRVLVPVLQAAQACGVRSIRNPFEPRWSLQKTPQASPLRRMEVQLLRRLRKQFLAQVAAHGLQTTDGSLGVLATGTLDAATLHSILQDLPNGTWELVCHPAYVDAELRATRTRLQDSRSIEVEALLATLAAQVATHANIPRIHFEDLHPQHSQ